MRGPRPSTTGNVTSSPRWLALAVPFVASTSCAAPVGTAPGDAEPEEDTAADTDTGSSDDTDTGDTDPVDTDTAEDTHPLGDVSEKGIVNLGDVGLEYMP